MVLLMDIFYKTQDIPVSDLQYLFEFLNHKMLTCINTRNLLVNTFFQLRSLLLLKVFFQKMDIHIKLFISVEYSISTHEAGKKQDERHGPYKTELANIVFRKIFHNICSLTTGMSHFTGRVMVKLVPCPGSDSTLISPPWLLMIP